MRCEIAPTDPVRLALQFPRTGEQPAGPSLMVLRRVDPGPAGGERGAVVAALQLRGVVE